MSPTLSWYVAAQLLLAPAPHAGAGQPESGRLTVLVLSGGQPVPQADVRVGSLTGRTDARGEVRLSVAAGRVEIDVERFGFEPATVTAEVTPAAEVRVTVVLTAEAVFEEEIVVTATRTERRIQDAPLRVEVVDADEVQEKLMMTPGDVAMLLNETGGLRVQITSPSLGAANVRVQGLRGRYTQILADGLPLHGGQTGALGLLQIPPMDLAQVEVIKGAASALYGGSALGGVINLVSKRPRPGQHEGEVLVNATSRGGTDAILWLADAPGGAWSYTLLGGVHGHTRADVDQDGWTDLPGYRRGVVRPRLFWEDGRGRSLFLTAGTKLEERAGGTERGATAPDGRPFAEELSTRSFDGGLVGRFLLDGGRLLTVRASATHVRHTHRFGRLVERDRHATAFGEVALLGSTGAHLWVVGGALQQDAYTARDFPAFDYAYTVPGVFAQDDVTIAPWLAVSASGRLDVHDESGTFFSPRVSALLTPSEPWTVRLSTGTGFFAPTPFTEETEAAGLSRLAPLGRLKAERGRSLSADVSWRLGELELNATLFRSTIDDALALRETGDESVEIVNAPGPTRTSGADLVGRYRVGPLLVLATHTYVWSTEPTPETGIRREVPLTPRHASGIDFLYEVEGRGRLGVEFFYTGRQSLDDNAFQTRSESYWVWGALFDWHVGRRTRIFVNGENVGGARMTALHPLVRPERAADGRWTVEAWAPLEGRVVNAGLRVRFW